MNKYSLHFTRLIQILLPISLRGKEPLTAWLQVLIYPLRRVYNAFTASRQRHAEELGYNSQYPNLQRLLNDQFDCQIRRIQVVDNAQSIPWRLIYPDAEHHPLMMGTVVIYPAASYGYQPFTVIVPLAVDFEIDNQKRMETLLNRYKFAGTKYIIVRN
jgi:hypothetical protein